jgi:hypothetical protein
MATAASLVLGEALRQTGHFETIDVTLPSDIAEKQAIAAWFRPCATTSAPASKPSKPR